MPALWHCVDGQLPSAMAGVGDREARLRAVDPGTTGRREIQRS